MAWFEGITDAETLRAEYRKLVMRWHPDAPNGDNDTMAEINAAYDSLFNRLKAEGNSRADRYDSHSWERTEETPEEFREAITKLVMIQDVEVELCGRWIWVTGDTYPHRQELREAGCRFSRKKSAWYWHSPKDGFRYRGHKSLQEIRDAYGSQKLSRGAGAIVTA